MGVIIYGLVWNIRLILFADSILALGLIALVQTTWLQAPLTWHPLVALGDISLTIYLLHVPIQMVIIIGAALVGWVIPSNQWWFWGAYMALVISSSFAVNRMFEQPMRNWLRGTP